MSITPRRYAGEDDLRRIQTATAHWIASAGFCGYLHVGDIALRLFNAMRRYDPREIVWLWEDMSGNLLGWAMVYPRWESYKALLHPAQRGGDLELQILDWCERETWDWMQRQGSVTPKISVQVYEDDTSRIARLEERGYQRDDHGHLHVVAERSLDEPIPASPLRDGFHTRSVAGEHEVDKLVAVQNASFDWSWTPDEYRQVMLSPFYQPEHHLIIAAPDGRFASFCYLLLDMVNSLGIFEDVGTHPDFRRLGLGRALLYEGMMRMKAQGMRTALMPYLAGLSAASALYESVGFRPKHNLYRYSQVK